MFCNIITQIACIFLTSVIIQVTALRKILLRIQTDLFKLSVEIHKIHLMLCRNLCHLIIQHLILLANLHIGSGYEKKRDILLFCQVYNLFQVLFILFLHLTGFRHPCHIRESLKHSRTDGINVKSLVISTICISMVWQKIIFF